MITSGASTSGSWISVDYAFQAIDTWFDDLHTFSVRLTL